MMVQESENVHYFPYLIVPVYSIGPRPTGCDGVGVGGGV